MESIAKALLAAPGPACYPLAMTDAAIQRAASTPNPRPKAPWQVWRDASGRLSGLRIAVLVFLFVPVAIATYDFTLNLELIGARPLNNVIHRTGYWALIFLMASLAITPLRRIARFNRLADVRRMIGVGAFVYAASHILLFVADQMFDLWKVASAIVLRLYLTIGFVTLLGLAALAATSTDGMVRRLGGRRWQRLHSAIYAIGLLALVHFFQQTKADVSVPTFAAGLFAWMLGYRFLIKFRNARDEPPAWMLLALSVVIAALTFIVEAVGIGIVFNVSPLRVLQTALDFDDLAMIRPGWLVLGAGLIVLALDLVRARFGRRRPARATPA
ncbi:MAG: sulfoxide reductase heme-binding subunit YedZ [Xanthobacteraceae bacterium]|nr:sulfoxide reductase heme-binding subunit YedZ [Xanthobacteraceae bacterium]